jgi:hypothetical protein
MMKKRKTAMSAQGVDHQGSLQIESPYGINLMTDHLTSTKKD